MYIVRMFIFYHCISSKELVCVSFVTVLKIMMINKCLFTLFELDIGASIGYRSHIDRVNQQTQHEMAMSIRSKIRNGNYNTQRTEKI